MCAQLMMSTKIPRTDESDDEPNNVTFDLVLHCSKTHTTDHKRVLFAELPQNVCVRDVKLQIEKEHNIPACVQAVKYETYPLDDDAQLESLRIRSGDTLHVTYYSDGNCKEIVEIISWMGLVLGILKQEDPSISAGISDFLDELVLVGIQAEFIEDLAFEYFFPWLDTKKYVNKLHFAYNGGLDITMEIYALLLRQPWPNCLIKLKYIEYGILRVLWNFSETFALRRHIIQLGGLQMCMRSLLRKTLEKGQPIKDSETPGDQNYDWILVETIGAALGTLCNLSEVPECHMEIAADTAVLLQMTCISLTTSVRIMSAQLVATLFLCIAYTTGTHEHLANPVIIERLLEACKMKRTFGQDEDEHTDTLMLEYFTQVFLAQVILVSPKYVLPEFHQQIYNHMDRFLRNTTYETIMEGEVKHWYVWSTFVPYLKLFYVPDTPQPEMMRKLQLLSQETVIFGLQNMLGRENHREVLVREGLVDYVTCLPSYVPDCLRPRARELVQMLISCGDLHVQPPRLVSLVKAELAKAHFGLERVLSMSVGEIVSEVL